MTATHTTVAIFIAVLGTFGCVTLNAVPRASSTILSKNEFKKLIESEKDPFSESAARKIKDYICAKGKPRREISKNIRFIMPSIPIGVPSDEARRIIKTLRLLVNKAVSTYYASLSENEIHLRYSENFSVGAPFLISPSEQKMAQNQVIETLKKNELGQYISRTKTHEFPRYSFSDSCRILLFCFLPIVFRFDDEKQLMSVVNISWFRITSVPPVYLRNMEILGVGNGEKSGGNKNVLPPIGFYENYPIELAALKKNMLLIASHELFGVWSATAERRELGDISFVRKSLRTDELEPMSESDLLNRSDNIWRAYFIANTEVQESVADDPNSYIFKLTLDTTPLCKHIRLKSEIVSQ